jgi:hypothetical protein
LHQYNYLTNDNDDQINVHNDYIFYNEMNYYLHKFNMYDNKIYIFLYRNITYFFYDVYVMIVFNQLDLLMLFCTNKLL